MSDQVEVFIHNRPGGVQVWCVIGQLSKLYMQRISYIDGGDTNRVEALDLMQYSDYFIKLDIVRAR